MGFQAVKPASGLENLKAKLKSGQVFQATITHSFIDTFTSDTLFTIGKIWIYQGGYRLESENRIIAVNDSISKVYNSIKEQLIISPYSAIEDDFAPSRFIQASETDFNIIEKANKKYEAQNAEILAYRKAMERKKRIYVLVTLIEANDSKVSQYDKEDLAEAITIVEQRAEVKRQQAEAEKRIEKLAFEEGGNNMSNEVLRTFQMEQFGIWNCDNPLLQQGFPVAVNFKDKQGNDLDFINLTTIIKAFNGVFQNFQSKTIKLYNSDIMLFGVKGNQFVYLTYEDYKKCNITPQTTAYTFTMNIYPDKITSKADIKRILNL